MSLQTYHLAQKLNSLAQKIRQKSLKIVCIGKGLGEAFFGVKHYPSNNSYLYVCI